MVGGSWCLPTIQQYPTDLREKIESRKDHSLWIFLASA